MTTKTSSEVKPVPAGITYHQMTNSQKRYLARYVPKVLKAYGKREYFLDPWFPQEVEKYEPRLYGKKPMRMRADVIIPFKSKHKDKVVGFFTKHGYSVENGWIADHRNCILRKAGDTNTYKFATIITKIKHTEQKPLKEEIEKIQIDKSLSLDERTVLINKVRENIKAIDAKFKTVLDDFSRFANAASAKRRSDTDRDLDDLIIVLTQDPHQMACMSFDRYWGSNCDNPLKDALESPQKSCLTLGDNRGIYRNVFSELRNGGCVAYLTTGDDVELHRPLARVWIRLFRHEENDIPKLVVENGFYCAQIVTNLKAEVADKIKEYIEAHQPEYVSGNYKRCGAAYSDSYGEIMKFIRHDDYDYISKNACAILRASGYNLFGNYGGYYQNTGGILPRDFLRPAISNGIQDNAEYAEAFKANIYQWAEWYFQQPNVGYMGANQVENFFKYIEKLKNVYSKLEFHFDYSYGISLLLQQVSSGIGGSKSNRPYGYDASYYIKQLASNGSVLWNGDISDNIIMSPMLMQQVREIGQTAVKSCIPGVHDEQFDSILNRLWDVYAIKFERVMLGVKQKTKKKRLGAVAVAQ